ncbi:MAG TPA: thioesterase family protein [Novosphingobium sp.]|nr:thioesterase family protein [Novosphingobium sp.]
MRSAAVSFVGPLFGAIEARARVLRAGRNATWVAAEVLRDGEVGLTATFAFMGPVASALRLNERPVPAGLIAPEQAKERVVKYAPTFLSAHFDVRFALPPAETRSPELCLWVRPRAREGMDDAMALLLSADALPPGVFPLLVPEVPPVSSMIWQANLLPPAPATRDGWWLLRSRGDYAENGCSSQVMEVWNADGQPVMAGMQSIALFG